MKNELPIGTVVSYRTNPPPRQPESAWDLVEVPESGKATIIGYDIWHTKYHAIKHSFDGVPMPTVKIWLFENEIV